MFAAVGAAATAAPIMQAASGSRDAADAYKGGEGAKSATVVAAAAAEFAAAAAEKEQQQQVRQREGMQLLLQKQKQPQQAPQQTQQQPVDLMQRLKQQHQQQQQQQPAPSQFQQQQQQPQPPMHLVQQQPQQRLQQAVHRQVQQQAQQQQQEPLGLVQLQRHQQEQQHQQQQGVFFQSQQQRQQHPRQMHPVDMQRQQTQLGQLFQVQQQQQWQPFQKPEGRGASDEAATAVVQPQSGHEEARSRCEVAADERNTVVALQSKNFIEKAELQLRAADAATKERAAIGAEQSGREAAAACAEEGGREGGFGGGVGEGRAPHNVKKQRVDAREERKVMTEEAAAGGGADGGERKRAFAGQKEEETQQQQQGEGQGEELPPYVVMPSMGLTIERMLEAADVRYKDEKVVHALVDLLQREALTVLADAAELVELRKGAAVDKTRSAGEGAACRQQRQQRETAGRTAASSSSLGGAVSPGARLRIEEVDARAAVQEYVEKYVAQPDMLLDQQRLCSLSNSRAVGDSGADALLQQLYSRAAPAPGAGVSRSRDIFHLSDMQQRGYLEERGDLHGGSGGSAFFFGDGFATEVGESSRHLSVFHSSNSAPLNDAAGGEGGGAAAAAVNRNPLGKAPGGLPPYLPEDVNVYTGMPRWTVRPARGEEKE